MKYIDKIDLTESREKRINEYEKKLKK